MNKLVAEGFILHRKDGTEERIVRDVEIRAEEPKVSSVKTYFQPGGVYQAENVSHEDVFESRDINSWTFIPEEVNRVQVPQIPLLRQTRPLIPIDEIVVSNQTTEIGRRIEPIIGCGVSQNLFFPPIDTVRSQNSVIGEIFDLSNRIIRTEQQPTFIVTGSGQWNPYEWQHIDRVEGQQVLITGINTYWTGADQTSIPIEESNPKLKQFLNRIFRGNTQKAILFIEPLGNTLHNEEEGLSFEELIYTSDDERQFRIRNISIGRSVKDKFYIFSNKDTTISEITRGRSHLFVCLDEEIDGMIQE